MPRKPRPDDDDVLTVETTSQPERANISVTTNPRELTEDEWTDLEVDLVSGIDAALAARKNLEQNLKMFLALYENEVEHGEAADTNPWMGASSSCPPIIAAEVEAMASYLIANVFVPRLIQVMGLTDESALIAPTIEKWKNWQLKKIRHEGTSRYQELIEMIKKSLVDGTTVLKVTRHFEKKKRLLVNYEAQVDDDGSPVLDDEGQPIRERVVVPSIQELNENRWKWIQLKDFMLLPAESRTINSAVATLEVVWLFEDDLRAMVRAGVFRKDKVEKILTYGECGNSDVESDVQGSEDKDRGGQIGIGMAQGSQTSKFFANRGPFKFFEIHSKQYDMNRDGKPEEHIYYVHYNSDTMAGHQDYEYVNEDRPYFAYSPFPRDGVFGGFSLVERLLDAVASISSNRNQTQNYLDLCVGPVLLRQEGATSRQRDHIWRPFAIWDVPDPKNTYQVFQLPQPPIAAFQIEGSYRQDIARVTGQDPVALGAQGAGKRSATEKKQQEQSRSVRASTPTLFFRFMLAAAVNFDHALDIQYKSDEERFVHEGKRFTVTPDMLSQDLVVSITGMSDAGDTMSAEQKAMIFWNTLKQFPECMQNPVRRQAAERVVLEEMFYRSDADTFIGSAEDAQKQLEAQQQAAQVKLQQMQSGQQPPPGQGGGKRRLSAAPDAGGGGEEMSA